MREWKIRMVEISKSYAELEVTAHTEQEAIEIAESLVKEDPDAYWTEAEIDDQYVEEIAEI